jgi:hypothetical protein
MGNGCQNANRRVLLDARSTRRGRKYHNRFRAKAVTVVTVRGLTKDGTIVLLLRYSS